MSEIVDKQSTFMSKLCELVLWIVDQGYQVTSGCFYCVDERHHKKGSFHYKKLAADLNLYKNGRYLSKTIDHQFAGEKWESMGGTWGGRFKTPDGNHYSWGE